ncbi:MAG: PP2C family protein-serine/threonine phosphatase [Acidobacteriota bacterium]
MGVGQMIAEETRPDGAMDLQQRIEKFTRRFSEDSRKDRKREPAGKKPSPLEEEYWRDIRELFTRDVTGRGLRQFIEREPRDAWKYFTREIDYGSLKGLPWHDRYPRAGWRVFVTMAHRLSPPRRILFTVAVPVLLVAWVVYLLRALGTTFANHWSLQWPPWVLVSATLLFALLVLELRDKLALKGDLEIARQIQFGLLPFEPYRNGTISIHSAMRPANTVGGDYFDVVTLPEGRVAVVMGDVAGKGMPAALLMALLQGSLRTLISAGLRGSELITKLNLHLHANIPSNRLITLFYSEVDPSSGAITYVNAGHNPPCVVRHDGTLETLPATGTVLGVVEAPAYTAGSIELAAGDRLFLYTDGLTEAFDSRDDQYGEVRLQAFLGANRDQPPRELLDSLNADVLAFCGSNLPHDDMTSMLVERTA